MRSNWRSKLLAASIVAALCIPAAPKLAAQDQQQPTSAKQETWNWPKQGRPYLNTRYRFETFQRDGSPFTAHAYAPTLRLALGDETPSFHGFSAFAELEAVEITGPADYNDPALPSQLRPNRPTILDPKSLQLSQGYMTWTHSIDHNKLQLTVGARNLR